MKQWCNSCDKIFETPTLQQSGMCWQCYEKEYKGKQSGNKSIFINPQRKPASRSKKAEPVNINDFITDLKQLKIDALVKLVMVAVVGFLIIKLGAIILW